MCLLPSGVNKQISREYVLELLKYHNKRILFHSLLLMESPSRTIDPIALQRQKSKLRRTTVEAVATKRVKDSWYQNEDDGFSVKESILSGIKYSSSMKKQRLQ